MQAHKYEMENGNQNQNGELEVEMGNVCLVVYFLEYALNVK